MTLIGRASMPRPRRPSGHGHLVGAILSGPGPPRIPRSCPMREPPRNPFAITWTRSAGIRCRPAAPCAAGATLPSNSTTTVHLTPTRARTDDRGMLRELPDDLMSKMGYRLAYGEAARLAEMARFDHGWGRDFAAGVGGQSRARSSLQRRKDLT
jgi:hypothetical protein